MPEGIPQAGDVVNVRHRQHLVERVADERSDAAVDLICLDDDAQGKRSRVLWDLELGARILRPEETGLGTVTKLDEPRHFAAYLHALKWNCVTATDARLFQAPFRAGIKLLGHQLIPLRRALELPRVNLFVADDVGLGKTIEAGLVLQELTLRQRVGLALIICPASVVLQWRDEMEKRFGIHFEVFSRDFVARKRQERGFAVNPWATHTHFIVSYQMLRRPEVLEPLRQHLGERAKKSILILDEAHNAAPASASKYAVDSGVTNMVRQLAPLFENRLFLSATPHNGHSNSFSSLLELLDPQRFTRGVPVTPEQRDTVMVRRLKSDLRTLGYGEGYPTRRVIRIELKNDQGRWFANGEDLGEGQPVELRLSELLAQFKSLVSPRRGELVFVNLQKRLLSSVEAFYRTLRVHRDALGRAQRAAAAQEPEEDELGQTDEQQEELFAQQTAAATTRVSVTEQARALLQQMTEVAERNRAAPDAKVRALLAWIRKNQLQGRNWNDRRVIIFTEFGDTKRYLLEQLTTALEDTDRASERILQLHGGMSDASRAAVQTAFNGDPARFPVRILLATDMAREGVNLQGHCADLFHFDIPWNPARMEQRNGRIDRTLQPSPEVRCAYFVYPQRAEDPVLDKVVEKVERIQEQLGSLASVVMERIDDALAHGIDPHASERVDSADQVPGHERVREELEAARHDENLREEIEGVEEMLNRSRKVMEFEEPLLRDALDVGCELTGAKGLSQNGSAFELPELPESWQRTLDALRPPREPGEAPLDWHKKKPQPVVFQAPDRIDSPLCHLHLQHPFVQRMLGRFLAQGFSAHDLSRVTVVRTSKDALSRVIAFGRLSLFGPGATRLHDEIVSVAALWREGKELKPFAQKADREAIDRLEEVLKEAPSLEGIQAAVRKKLIAAAPGDFAALWTYVKEEAQKRARRAEDQLATRGKKESEALRDLLKRQRQAIEHTLRHRPQIEMQFEKRDEEQQKQYEKDGEHMQQRLVQIAHEIESEPEQIVKQYQVAFPRIVPVGLIYLWPSTR